ncbi:sigma-70 family RNA polymerase sigma factor [Clostridium sp. 'White wine YQ']|uniref:sigma-70 family RNA polymerase sigma factor n=1 Tax=Clostridium sp. 'White wine YQ' TaxID=3027474 RepID=UPI002366170E|nr:sigma-70 family RNA polymerase sigma factor [Clostridium sp. 'White wine YQ']MDD7795874.1 sigma-70 family RNA polymerase sigma factor [Clostridium sp. 'White wine YQ']
MDNVNEEKLIKGILRKDKECLSKLMNIYGNLVYYIAKNILKEAHEKECIEECYNDVFTAIWFNIDCFNKEKGSFKSWLISVTKYKALDIKRKNLRHSSNIEYMDEVSNEENHELERIENIELINELLSNLEEKDKLIIIKRYLDGVPIKEIGESLGYSEEYIYTRISRAKKKIQKIVGEINE